MRSILQILPAAFRRRGIRIAGTLLLRAVLNLAGLAALLPALTLVLDPAGFEGDGPLAHIYAWSGLESPRTFALVLCAGVVAFMVVKCGVNFLLARAERRYIYDLYRTLSRRLYVAYHDRGLAFTTAPTPRCWPATSMSSAWPSPPGSCAPPPGSSPKRCSSHCCSSRWPFTRPSQPCSPP